MFLWACHGVLASKKSLEGLVVVRSWSTLLDKIPRLPMKRENSAMVDLSWVEDYCYKNRSLFVLVVSGFSLRVRVATLLETLTTGYYFLGRTYCTNGTCKRKFNRAYDILEYTDLEANMKF